MGSGESEEGSAASRTYNVEGLVKRAWDDVVLALEKVGEQLHAKPIGEPVSGDAAATRSTTLRLGHAFYGALMLAHAHACVCLVAMDLIIFSPFRGEGAGLRVGRELDESLMGL